MPPHEGSGQPLLQLADVNVAEPKFVAVVLQLNLAGLKQRLRAVPEIFQRHIARHECAVEKHMHAIAHHQDAETVPARLISHHQRFARAFLVVVQPARTHHRVGLATARIPDLHLRRAAQIDAAVALRQNLPFHQHLEVAIVARGGQAVALAIERQCALLHRPVVAHALIGLVLRGAQRGGREQRAFDGIIVGSSQQPLPAGQIFSVKQHAESRRRHIVENGARQFADADVAEIHGVAVPQKADVPFVAQQARMFAQRVGVAQCVDVGIENLPAVEHDGDLPPAHGHFLLVPLPHRFLRAALRPLHVVERAVILRGLELGVLGGAVVEDLQLHPVVVEIRGHVGAANAQSIIGTSRQAKLKTQDEVFVLLLRKQIAARALDASDDGIGHAFVHDIGDGVTHAAHLRPTLQRAAIEQADEAVLGAGRLAGQMKQSRQCGGKNPNGDFEVQSAHGYRVCVGATLAVGAVSAKEKPC